MIALTLSCYFHYYYWLWLFNGVLQPKSHVRVCVYERAIFEHFKIINMKICKARNVLMLLYWLLLATVIVVAFH